MTDSILSSIQEDDLAAVSEARLGDEDHLPAPRVRRRYGISEMTLWRWLRDEKFPQPDMTIAGRRYWRVRALRAWEASRGAGNATRAA